MVNVKQTDKVALALSKAVTYQTIANGDFKPFEGLIAFLKGNYPLVFSRCESEIVGEASLFIKWKGKAEKRPVMLTAHLDVVPAENPSQWKYPPFDGTVAEGFVWGRGAFDVKLQVICILETVEALIADGFEPQGDVFIGFGCNEEIGGDGAKKICALLKERGVELDMLLDEGGAVALNFMKGMTSPVAAVGTAEKGSLNLRLEVKADGGHSASPKNPTPLGVISRAVWNVERKQFGVRYTSIIPTFLRKVGGGLKGPTSFLLKHNNLFRPIINSVFCKSPNLAPFIRNTHAATMSNTGKAMNVIDSYAEAIVNIRFLPGYTTDEIIKDVKKMIKDENVEVSIVSCKNASVISPSDTKQFELLENTIKEAFSDAVVTPYLMIGGSDAMNYEAVCKNIYRFTPARMVPEELSRMHGTDERISFENLGNAMNFYNLLLKKL